MTEVHLLLDAVIRLGEEKRKLTQKVPENRGQLHREKPFDVFRAFLNAGYGDAILRFQGVRDRREYHLRLDGEGVVLIGDGRDQWHLVGCSFRMGSHAAEIATGPVRAADLFRRTISGTQIGTLQLCFYGLSVRLVHLSVEDGTLTCTEKRIMFVDDTVPGHE